MANTSDFCVFFFSIFHWSCLTFLHCGFSNVSSNRLLESILVAFGFSPLCVFKCVLTACRENILTYRGHGRMKSFPPNLRRNQTDWQRYQSRYLTGSWGTSFEDEQGMGKEVEENWGLSFNQTFSQRISYPGRPSFLFDWETFHRIARSLRRQRDYHDWTRPILFRNPKANKNTKWGKPLVSK